MAHLRRTWIDKCEPLLWDYAGGRLHLQWREEWQRDETLSRRKRHGLLMWTVTVRLCRWQTASAIKEGMKERWPVKWKKLPWFTWKGHGFRNVNHYWETKQVAGLICNGVTERWDIEWKKVTWLTNVTVILRLSRWQAASAIKGGMKERWSI
jgi:hypothetical protein